MHAIMGESALRERILAELSHHPRSIVQLTYDLGQPPWVVFRTVHELNRGGQIVYAPGRGQWCLAGVQTAAESAVS
jgi:DNA-binding IclR family transcriptional regulator